MLRLHRIALGLPAFHNMHAKLPLASLTFKEANFVGTIQLQNAHQPHRLFTGRARLHIWQRARLSHLASPEHVKRVGSNLNGDVLTVRGACPLLRYLGWFSTLIFSVPLQRDSWNPAAIYQELSLSNDISSSLPGLRHSQSIEAQPGHLGEWHAGERNVQAYKALPTRTLFYAWTRPKVVREHGGEIERADTILHHDHTGKHLLRTLFVQLARTWLRH